MKPFYFRATGAQYSELRSRLLRYDGGEAVILGRCGHHLSDESDIAMLFDISHVIAGHDASPEVTRHFVETQRQKPSGLMPIALRLMGDKGQAESQPLNGAAACAFDTFVTGAVDTDGRLTLRLHRAGVVTEANRIMIVGDDLIIQDPAKASTSIDGFDLRQIQAFGQRTNSILRSLTVGVVGCSGTGSWVIEQLMRLGVRRLVLVDPKRVGRKNLNRIVNSRAADAQEDIPKVDIFARTSRESGLPVEVLTFASDLDDRHAVLALAKCDVLFGCTDSAKGRDDLTKVATFYCQPYIDMGIVVNPDGKGGVRSINGHVHYLIPGELGLAEFGVYQSAQLQAEDLRKRDPEVYADQLEQGYLPGIPEESPAVVSLNGLIASQAVNELLFRLHPCRADSNSAYRAIGVAITEMANVALKPLIAEPNIYLRRNVGRGDCQPLLDNPALG